MAGSGTQPPAPAPPAAMPYEMPASSSRSLSSIPRGNRPWRFQLKTSFPWIPHYHHIMVIINCFAIITFSFLLAGCSSSNGLRNIYLVSLSYRDGGSDISTENQNPLLQANPNMTTVFAEVAKPGPQTIREINIGFTSLCLRLAAGPWVCGTDFGDLVSDLRRDPGSDPLNLIWVAENVRTSVLWYGLTIAATVLVFLSTLLLASFPGRHEEMDSGGSGREVKPFPTVPVHTAVIFLLALATMLALVSAIWQHLAGATASALIQLLTYNAVEAKVGAAAMALGWVGTLLIGICLAWNTVLILSMRALAFIT